MKILIHGINFSPEFTGIGKYSGEMAEWLATHGHEVRVVTAPPYYPQWRVGGGRTQVGGAETRGKGKACGRNGVTSPAEDDKPFLLLLQSKQKRKQ